MGKNNAPSKHEKFQQRYAAQVAEQGHSPARSTAELTVPMEPDVWSAFREAVNADGVNRFLKEQTRLSTPQLSNILNKGVATPTQIEAIANFITIRTARIGAALGNSESAPVMTNEAFA